MGSGGFDEVGGLWGYVCVLGNVWWVVGRRQTTNLGILQVTYLQMIYKRLLIYQMFPNKNYFHHRIHLSK